MKKIHYQSKRPLSKGRRATLVARGFKGFIFLLVLCLITTQLCAFASVPVTSLCHIDFSDFVSESSSGYKSYKSELAFNVYNGHIDSTTIDEQHGKSISVTSAKSGTAPNLYFLGAVKDDVACYGFSVYADSSAWFYTAMKGVSGSWSASDTIGNLFRLEYGKFSFLGKQITTLECTTAAWYDVRIIFNHTKHIASVCINGTECASGAIDASIKTIGQINFNLKDGYEETVSFDDLVAFPINGDTSTPTLSTASTTVAPDLDSIEATFPMEVAFEPRDASVEVVSDDDDVIRASVEELKKDGIVRGAKISLLSSLKPSTHYTVSITGVTDLLGNALTIEGDFTTISTDPSVTLQASSTVGICGDTVLTINTANIVEPAFDVYQNGALTAQITDNTYIAHLSGGSDEFYVVETSTDTKSNTVALTTPSYELGSTVYSCDFSKGTSSGATVNEKSGTAEVMTVDNTFALKLTWDGTGDAPYVIFPTVTTYDGIFVWEADYYITVGSEQKLLSLKTDSGSWFTALTVSANGAIQGYDSSNQPYAISTLEKDGWVHAKVLIDTDAWTYSTYLNGVGVGLDTAISAAGTRVQYVNFGLMSKGEIAIDNINLYYIHKCPTTTYLITLDNGSAVDSLSVPYDKQLNIHLHWDAEISNNSLAGITLRDSNQNVIWTLDPNGAIDKMGWLLNTGGNQSELLLVTQISLKANTTYTLDLSVVKSKSGVGVSNGIVTFTTTKAPYCIDTFELKHTTSSTQAVLTIQNKNNDTRTAFIFLTVYDGNKLIAINNTPVEAGKLAYTIDVPVYNENYKVEAYLLDDNLAVIDSIK